MSARASSIEDPNGLIVDCDVPAIYYLCQLQANLL